MSRNAIRTILFGSLTFGRLGDSLRKKFLLSGLYSSRTILMLLLLLLPIKDRPLPVPPSAARGE
ncbi:MAG: hypothetical protein Tsb0017_12380 [Geothermobacteraceae bacterium]